MGAAGIVGFGALALVVVGWLVVSFTQAGPRRAALEWLSASCGFTALGALFVHLASEALASGNTFALVAFGFLLVIFSSSLVVSIVQAFLALRSGGSGSEASATH
jgi:hypothetical protein